MTCSVEDAAEAVLTTSTAMPITARIERGAFIIWGVFRFGKVHNLPEGVDRTLAWVSESMGQNR